MLTLQMTVRMTRFSACCMCVCVCVVQGRTALHLASYSGHVEVVSTLLGHGSEIAASSNKASLQN